MRSNTITVYNNAITAITVTSAYFLIFLGNRRERVFFGDDGTNSAQRIPKRTPKRIREQRKRGGRTRGVGAAASTPLAAAARKC